MKKASVNSYTSGNEAWSDAARLGNLDRIHGVLGPRVDLCSHSPPPPRGFPAPSGSALPRAAFPGAQVWVGSPSLTLRKTKNCPSTWAPSLSKASRARRPTRAMPRWVNDHPPHHHGMPGFFRFYRALHLRIYDERCVGMERWV